MIREDVREVQLSIRKISEAAAEKEDCVRWDIGQPSFDTPENVKKAAKLALDDKQEYSPTKGIEELRKAVADEESIKEGIEVGAENVKITTGGMEALYSIFAARLDQEDTLLVNDPSWGPYRLMSVVNGNKVEQCSFFDENGELTRKVEKTVRTAELLVVNSPSNPAGRVFSKKEAKALAELADETGTFLVTDEVYWRLTYGKKHHSPAAFAENSAIIGSSSKNHAMTGWRIGWLVDSAENVEQYSKVSRALTAAPNRLGQRAAVEALQNDSHVEEMRKEYENRRDIAVERMKALGWEFEVPEGAIYAFPDVGRDGWEFAMEALEEAGIAVVPGESFGPGCDTRIRICFGATDRERLKEGFDRLESWL